MFRAEQEQANWKRDEAQHLCICIISVFFQYGPLHCEVNAVSHLLYPRGNPLLFLILLILVAYVLVLTPRKTMTLIYLSSAAPVNWGIKRWGQWECSLKMMFRSLSPKIFTLQYLHKLSVMKGWKSNYLSIFWGVGEVMKNLTFRRPASDN